MVRSSRSIKGVVMFRITTSALAILLLAMLLICSGLDRAAAQSVGSQYSSTAP